MDAVLSGAPEARTFSALPDRAEAFALLKALNAWAPGGTPTHPGEQALWLYGAGNLGRLARSHLDHVGQPIAGVVDREADRHREDPFWDGFSVLRPDEVPADVKDAALLAVSVVTAPFVPLRDALRREGWKTILPFYDVAEAFRDRHPLSNGWFADPMDAAALEDAQDVLEGFADDASRAHYLRFAAWRLGREEWDFPASPVTIDDRFFIPEILRALREDERVLDAGAHHGEVAARFFSVLGDRLAQLWAVEPDLQNMARLKEAVASWPAEQKARLETLEAILAEGEGPVRFHVGLGYASQIVDEAGGMGGSDRPATTIDALGFDPTIVKLHLEGGELAALKGARKTIARCRPIVMLTIYHDAAGLLATPRWLESQLDRYALFMRTHAYCGTGAVLYAIPKERMA